jgi:hypothetical protein
VVSEEPTSFNTHYFNKGHSTLLIWWCTANRINGVTADVETTIHGTLLGKLAIVQLSEDLPPFLTSFSPVFKT